MGVAPLWPDSAGAPEPGTAGVLGVCDAPLGVDAAEVFAEGEAGAASSPPPDCAGPAAGVGWTCFAADAPPAGGRGPLGFDSSIPRLQSSAIPPHRMSAAAYTYLSPGRLRMPAGK